MAIETAVPMGDGVAITDRDRSGFTADVALSKDDIVAVLMAMNPDDRSRAIAAAQPRPVMILNTDKAIKAANLCDRLTWSGIAHSFELIGTCYTVSVAEQDVKAALGSDL